MAQVEALGTFRTNISGPNLQPRSSKIFAYKLVILLPNILPCLCQISHSLTLFFINTSDIWVKVLYINIKTSCPLPARPRIHRLSWGRAGSIKYTREWFTLYLNSPNKQELSLPIFHGKTNENKFGKVEKCDFYRLKMAAILWNLEQLGQNFALHSKTTHGMCMQNMIGISATLKAL